MRNNRLNFAGAVAATLMAAVINLVLSWLLQQIIDASTGKNQTFDLLQLLFISSGTAILLVAILMLNGKTNPRFVEKAMAQYKNMAFSEISKKSIILSRPKTPRPTSRRCPTTRTASRKTT